MGGGIAPTIGASGFGKDRLIMEKQVKRLGGLYDKGNKKHQMGSVYDKSCLAPTIDTMGGGYREPITVIRKKKFRGGWKLMCSTTVETTPAFTHFHKNYYPTIKANSHDVGIVEYRND